MGSAGSNSGRSCEQKTVLASLASVSAYHRQVISREYNAESWHYGAGGSPSAHLSAGCHPWGHKEGKEGGGKDELFEANRKSESSSLTVSYLADCLRFCGAQHDMSNLQS